MKVIEAGTFIFCKGALIVDGWAFETAPGEEVTQDGVNRAILAYLHAGMVDAPTLEAQLAAAQAIQRMRRDA